MTTYDVYGVKLSTLEAAREAIELALGIKFVAHESMFLGGDYYRLGDVGEECFILQQNYNEFEGEWTDSAYKEYAYLLYVNETERAHELEKLLMSVACLLRRA
ncbi:hypothetical protein LZC95_09355 [Pendulispora brunnea]|uniref:CDI immunity protein domain-containing protein n=1 Tax=Pendulispora brunnea TaxID=2905690 RepID=A0ABZ2KIZ9_9BACT